MTVPINWHIGEKFSRLMVLAPAGKAGSGRQAGAMLLCVCDCGNFKLSRSQSIVNGRTRSCGCLKADFFAAKSENSMRRLHPGEYNSWAQMRSRCNDPGANGYHRYGGRGVSVCAQWEDFAAFLADMGKRPTRHSIDRINVDGNYEPGNCRWATSVEQANNTSRTVSVTIGDETKSLTQWARCRGLNSNTVRTRLSRGWSVERALA